MPSRTRPSCLRTQPSPPVFTFSLHVHGASPSPQLPAVPEAPAFLSATNDPSASGSSPSASRGPPRGAGSDVKAGPPLCPELPPPHLLRAEAGRQPRAWAGTSNQPVTDTNLRGARLPRCSFFMKIKSRALDVRAVLTTSALSSQPECFWRWQVEWQGRCLSGANQTAHRDQRSSRCHEPRGLRPGLVRGLGTFRSQFTAATGTFSPCSWEVLGQPPPHSTG